MESYEHEGVNPFHFVSNIISGKWKMSLLRYIHRNGCVRFNETKKLFPISEKVLSQQLKELASDGLIERIQYNTIPLKVEYKMTPLGEELVPALDILYFWSVRRMKELGIEIEPDVFHLPFDMEYEDMLQDIIDEHIKAQHQHRLEREQAEE